jgi:hypothetical protein
MEKTYRAFAGPPQEPFVIGVVLGFLIGMAALSVYFWITRHRRRPVPAFYSHPHRGWVISRVASKFTYEAGKKALRIVKTGLFGGEKIFEIPYRDIDGIYYDPN